MTVGVCLRNNNFHYLYIEQTQNFQKFECSNSKLLGNLVEFIIAIRKKINIPFDIPLSIVLDDRFSVWRRKRQRVQQACSCDNLR